MSDMDDEHQIEQNNSILASFHQASIRRRLRVELDKMYPDYAQIIAEISIINDEPRLKITIYEINESNHRQKYEFIMSNDYPFKSPIIFFQNRPYREFLQIKHTAKYIQLFRQVTGQDCLCCYSITRTYNWSPGITLSRIIDEIRDIKRKKRNVINKLFADKIKQKYLIDDINLDSWLY